MHMPEETPKREITFTSKLEERVTFFLVCVGVVALTYAVLFLVDFLPEKPGTEAAQQREATSTEEVAKEARVVANPLPVTIIFDSLNREVPVLNPESDSVEALDAALLSGVIRHPDSADFKNEGTIFLLGHSSYLPNVRNKNFQAFNGIQKLEWGDTIRLRSKDTEYVYRVERVYEAKASNAEVPLQFEEPTLVLATCNSFGTKDDRFIVESKLVETRPVGETPPLN